MKKIGQFLLAKNSNAVIVAFAATMLQAISIPTGFIAAVIVGLVTLVRGYRSGLIVLAWVALPAIAMLVLGRVGGFDLLLLRCVLVWLFAIILAQYASWRFVLEVAAMLGVVAVVIMHLVIPDIAQWWTGHITTYFKELSKATDLKISAAEIQQIIQRLVPMASGIVCFFILIGSFVQLLLARWWQSHMFNPGGLRKEFVQIEIGRTLAVALLLVLVGVMLDWHIMKDILPVLVLPFVLAGLSLLHYFAEIKRGLVIPLLLLYMAILFLPFLVIGLLACVGYADSWFSFRKRVRKTCV